jgi:predicted metal-dependent HD superfamily phosphohydrolase
MEDQMPTDDHRVELMARWNTTLPQQSELGENLITRYREPHRHYHTAKHLLDVLTMIDQLADDHDLFLVQLAAWYHDAIYVVPAGQLSNEEASARLALRELSLVGLEQEDLNQIARLVRLTETHLPGPRDPEGELLCDADLSILASDPAQYADYVAAIRAEYAQAPEEQFLAGRLAVLSELADREIFHTRKGRQLSDAARANVVAEIAGISERLGIAVEGSDV